MPTDLAQLKIFNRKPPVAYLEVWARGENVAEGGASDYRRRPLANTQKKSLRNDSACGCRRCLY